MPHIQRNFRKSGTQKLGREDLNFQNFYDHDETFESDPSVMTYSEMGVEARDMEPFGTDEMFGEDTELEEKLEAEFQTGMARVVDGFKSFKFWVEENRLRALGTATVLIVAFVGIGFFLTRGGDGGGLAPEEVLTRIDASSNNLSNDFVVAGGGSDGGLENPYLVETDEAEKLKAHVVGAVVNPGVYEFEVGQRVEDLIILAGGVTKDANPHALSLASKLSDGQKVCVPLLVLELEKDGCENQLTSTAQGLTNINLAGVGELDELVGIGPSLANAIVDYRNRNGAFKSVDDLANISGITTNVIDKFRSQITVR